MDEKKTYLLEVHQLRFVTFLIQQNTFEIIKLILASCYLILQKSTLSDPIQAVACSSTQDNHSSNSAPISELRLDPYRVLPFEEEANAEYFRGKSGQKTPERYLRIRNHIIGLWLKQQPRYLNKTSSRMGLKNCGDVNCIGLIHDYLERIGAINFGCPQTNAKKDRTAPDSTSLKKVSLIFSSTQNCRRINRIDIVKSD